MAGVHDLVVAAGVESMTRVPMESPHRDGDHYPPELRARYDHRLVPQSIAAELVASEWGILREECDDLGYRSHVRAAAAARTGRFGREILPLELTSDGVTITAGWDEGVRMKPDRARMAELPPSFQDARYDELFPGRIGWVVTAGNASQISDGAAAVLVASRERAEQLGLVSRARFVSFAVAGASPVLMLTAPIPATRAALDRAGLTVNELDVVEINEAFASPVLAWKKELDVSDGWFEEHVNPNGGAIALGHPLGASGCRLMTTLLHELERRSGRYGLETICEGGGMANATIVERLR
jgi:acetyl-CoA acetyltransferase family protein